MSTHTETVENVTAATRLSLALRVSVCRSWSELEHFRESWNELLAQNHESSIFQTPEWLASWWSAFGAGKDLVGLVFLDHLQKAVAIAPLYLVQRRQFPFQQKYLRLVGAGSGDSDALDVIVKPGMEEMVAEAFVDWLSNDDRWSICSLETLPRHSRFGECLAALLAQHRWSVFIHETVHFFVDLPGTWEGYLARLEPQFRPLLTRYPKRLQSRYKSARAFRCETPQDLDKELPTLFALHQMRWTGRGEPGAFSDGQRREFYSKMAMAFLERGWLEFWLLTLEGETVAGQFCFRYHDVVYLLQEGFDPKYAADKVGYALRARVLQEMIGSGATRYDFLGGDDHYKLKFGARQDGYSSLHFAGPSWQGTAYLLLRRIVTGAKRWLKNRGMGRLREALDGWRTRKSAKK